MKYIKNSTISNKTWLGTIVAAGVYYAIEVEEETQWANDSILLIDISSGDAIVAKSSDGLSDISDVNEAINYLKDNIPKEVELTKKSPLTGRPEVIIVESEGDGETIPSHNFMDKTSWHQASTRVIGETPTLDAGKIYDLVQEDIIDCTHGKITFEDDLVDCIFKAHDDSVELTIETDYTVDYNNGKITLDANYTLSGVLTVDYSHAEDSTFKIVPPTGKILSVKDAEIQFTSDLTMKPMTFEIWAYDPNDLPNKAMVFCKRYKNIKDIINVARQGKGVIPAIDVLTKNILVFPFSYDRKIALEASKGMELRVKTDDDLVMGGEYGTITFYVTYEDEIG